MISGYSLTGEKCTVCEPSQPASTAVWTSLQLARWCESALCISILLKRDVPFQTSESTWPQRSAALQSMSVSPPLCTHGTDFIYKKKTTWRWPVTICES